MKIYDESLYCSECGDKIDIAKSLFQSNYCDDCFLAIERAKKLEKARKRAARKQTRSKRNV